MKRTRRRKRKKRKISSHGRPGDAGLTVASLSSAVGQWQSQEGNRLRDGDLWPPAPSSGSLVVVLLVAVELVGVIGGHV